MAKKDFSKMNTAPVYSSIAESIAEEAPQAQYAQDELEALQEAGKTQGRKGAKAIRFNMAFPPSVYEYIQTMARVRGESVTKFTQFVFEKSMKENAEVYEQAKKLTESFK